MSALVMLLEFLPYSKEGKRIQSLFRSTCPVGLGLSPSIDKNRLYHPLGSQGYAVMWKNKYIPWEVVGFYGLSEQPDIWQSLKYWL